MKKNSYEKPETKIIELKAETSVLTVSPPIDSNPVLDAQEGDVSGWGGWM